MVVASIVNQTDLWTDTFINREDGYMELIKQPVKSFLCGQATIAMLAGITLDESIQHFGHASKSVLTDYTRVLGVLGISYSRCQKVDGRKRNLELPNKAIVRLQYVGKKTGHLIAYADGKFYDSAKGIFNSKEELLQCYNANTKRRTRIDWYMEILGNNKVDKKVAGN